MSLALGAGTDDDGDVDGGRIVLGFGGGVRSRRAGVGSRRGAGTARAIPLDSLLDSELDSELDLALVLAGDSPLDSPLDAEPLPRNIVLRDGADCDGVVFVGDAPWESASRDACFPAGGNAEGWLWGLCACAPCTRSIGAGIPEGDEPTIMVAWGAREMAG